MRKLIILITALSTLAVTAQERHGLYVAQFNEILGNEEQEFKLLDFCQRTGTNALTFYQLDEIDFNILENRENLRRFITYARQEYYIKHFGAASESFRNFKTNIHPYNTDPKTHVDARIDAYNIEFEFWNKIPSKEYYCTRFLAPAGFPCNQEGAFQYVMGFVRGLRSLANELPGTDVEVYVGWLDEEHAKKLTPKVDRIYYAVYQDMEPNGSLNLYHYGMQRARLKYLAAAGPVEIVPIFSGSNGGSDPNLYNWLRRGNHPIKAWWHYQKNFNNDRFLRKKENLKLSGYQWFYYNGMPRNVSFK